jgi:hypothetical protein
MRDILTILAFVGMILVPGIVAARSSEGSFGNRPK